MDTNNNPHKNRGGYRKCFTLLERLQIEKLIKENVEAPPVSYAHISRILGRSQFSVAREVTKNGGRDHYDAKKAHAEAQKRIDRRSFNAKKELTPEQESSINQLMANKVVFKKIREQLGISHRLFDRYLRENHPDYFQGRSSIPQRVQNIEEQIAILFEIVRGRK